MKFATGAALAAALMLSGCGGTVVRDRPVTVKVPVVQPCASGTRPARPPTLDSQTPGWDGMDLRQRVAAIGAWALKWVGYAEDLEVELAGCPGVNANRG